MEYVSDAASFQSNKNELWSIVQYVIDAHAAA